MLHRYLIKLRSIRANPLLLAYVLFLFVLLFLGDGKQSVVDVIGSGGVLALYIIAQFFYDKKRDISVALCVSWSVFLVYTVIRTLFSDDVGYSVYAVVRYIDAFLLYYIFYCYSSDKTYKSIVFTIVGFSVFVLLCASVVTLVPGVHNFLPSMNLLYPVYGHNHVVDILLFSYAVCVVLWLQTQKKSFGFIAALFVFGTAFSYARAALLFETLFFLLVSFFGSRRPITSSFYWFVLALLVALLSVIMFIPQPLLQSATRGRILPKTNKQRILNDNRFNYWRQAIVSIRERPLFGSGPGTFYLQSKKYTQTNMTFSWFAHNIVLELATELGVVGLLCIAFIVLFSLRNISFYNNPLALSVLLVAAYSMVDFTMNYLLIWIIWWSMLGILPNREEQ